MYPSIETVNQPPQPLTYQRNMRFYCIVLVFGECRVCLTNIPAILALQLLVWSWAQIQGEVHNRSNPPHFRYKMHETHLPYYAE